MMLRRLLAPALFLASLSACAQPAAPAAPKPAARPAAATTAPVPMPGFVPKLGTDYFVLPTPQPTYGQGKIELAEVFSYACIHCAEFQPKVNVWKKTLPADVRWEYVPAVFGGIWDNFGRAFFAAQLMGIQPKTHDNVFKGVFVEQAAGKASPEEIAAMYARWGVDKDKFLAAMNSFGVTGKLSRARQFAMRTGINSTPTLVINGKYRVEVTPQRGFDGMITTANWLLAQERAATAKPAAAAKKG